MPKAKFYILIIVFLFFGASPVRADTTGVINFLTYVIGSITFDVTGTLTTSIDASSGALGTGLNINYQMTSNNAVNNLQLKAVVLNSTGAKVNGFYSIGGTSMFLVLGNTSAPPTAAAISNCQQASSTSTLNPNAIAYSGTITIDNSGTISYNAGGYYNFGIRRNTTNLNMSIITTPKPGTFDSTTALDEPGPYTVEIYIDNI